MVKPVGAALFLVWILILAWRIVMPKPGFDTRGPITWIEIAFLVGLYIPLILVGLGLGRSILRSITVPSLTRFESGLLEGLLGLGVLSLGVAALGFAGWLTSWAILLWLVVSGIPALREFWGAGFCMGAIRFPRAITPYLIFLQLIAFSAIPLLLIECVAPVWDYDALLYHLEVPRHYLAQGGIYLTPRFCVRRTRSVARCCSLLAWHSIWIRLPNLLT